MNPTANGGVSPSCTDTFTLETEVLTMMGASSLGKLLLGGAKRNSDTPVQNQIQTLLQSAQYIYMIFCSFTDIKLLSPPLPLNRFFV